MIRTLRKQQQQRAVNYSSFGRGGDAALRGSTELTSLLSRYSVAPEEAGKLDGDRAS